MPQPVLETRDLTIRFGGHVAVDGVSAAFHAGTLTAIVGPNGAGKTTYFNLISGQLPASAGAVLIDGVEVTKLGAARRAKLGIGRAFQLTNLFPNLTVHENVRLAVQAHAGGGANILSRWNSRRDWIEGADRFIEAANLADKRDTPAVALPHGDKRKLEVAIMMALEPHVFMFDEPTAGMSVDDVPVILDLIKTAQGRGRQDHPAGRAQDGRGQEPGRPHRRPPQRAAGGRRRAGRGDRLGRGAGGLSGRRRIPKLRPREPRHG